MSDLEKLSNLIPQEVRQTPTGGEHPTTSGDAEKQVPTEKSAPAGDIPDVEPGPSEPSQISAEEDGNSTECSEDSGR